jgi:hypothetical protein
MSRMPEAPIRWDGQRIGLGRPAHKRPSSVVAAASHCRESFDFFGLGFRYLAALVSAGIKDSVFELQFGAL